MSKIINGKQIAADLKEDLARTIKQLNLHPQLTILTIGDNDASKVYVKNKLKAAEEIGIAATQYKLDDIYFDNNFKDKLQEIIAAADGVILQLPVPSYVDVEYILKFIPPHKDVDGLTVNQMGLLRDDPTRAMQPCTPKGIISLLKHENLYQGAGKNALVIGRSNLVGRPIAELLLQEDWTVTIAHSKTRKENLCKLFSNADLVVSAAGATNLLTEYDSEQFWKDNRHDPYGDFHFKRSRVIIDVSTNRNEEGKLCGDFSEEFKQKFSEYYTPVPGGVGPMTVATLLQNTVIAALGMQLV